MFTKVLIANRGEIVSRIIRTLRSMNIKSVAVFEEGDRNLKYVSEADVAISLGRGNLASTYLNGEKLIRLATKSGAQAIHPGYGFLSENADFAGQVITAGLHFIGPSPESIRLMGKKVEAIFFARKLKIPVIPGFYGSADEIINQMSDADYPVVIKASAGGGGKAMRVAGSLKELSKMLKHVNEESKKYFGVGKVYAERYLESPRHIEVQVLGDQKGNIVHLFERECSIQRRHQKIIEESPAVNLPSDIRSKILNDALKLAKGTGYYSAGTVEFLLDANGNHYFLEMNTRIQVEHPVTEMISGVDIVKEQINIAAGNPLPEYLYHLHPNGHAIEARIYAEDPKRNFQPSPGHLTLVKLPEQVNVRIEHSLSTGDCISDGYDPLLAKIITKGNNRTETIKFLHSALSDSIIQGIDHNIFLLKNILNDPDFRRGNLSTQFIDSKLNTLIKLTRINEEEKMNMIMAGLYLSLYQPLFNVKNGYWRIHRRISCHFDEEEYKFMLHRLDKDSIIIICQGKIYGLMCCELSASEIIYQINDNKAKLLHYSWHQNQAILFLSTDNEIHTLTRNDFLIVNKNKKKASQYQEDNNELNVMAPLSGRIIRLNYNLNDKVEKGNPILVIESMKMENELRIADTAIIKKIYFTLGDQVQEGDLLLELNKERI